MYLTGMTQGGEAIGRDAEGRVVFVPLAIAGEHIVAEVVEEKKNYVRARLLKVVEPSAARVAPRCIHFGARTPPPTTESSGAPSPSIGSVGCGGCQWQHIGYAAQLRFKSEILREQFTRIGKLPEAPVRDTLGMDEPWHYRNNVQFQLDGEGHLCFRAMESHDLVRISECHILHLRLDEMFSALELEGTDLAGVTLRAGTRTGQKLLILEGRDDVPPEISVDEPISIVYQMPNNDLVPLVGKEALHEELRGRLFRVSPMSFFQVNTALAETLVDLVEQYLAPRATDVLLDLFGGVGTFGLLLAPRVARVIEVEENPSAVDDARANAIDLTNVEFRQGRAEDVLLQLKTPIDIVVADPPRAGIAPRALDSLIAISPRTIVYVSCDPATLARDARRLVDGNYRLVQVQPVDLFPQTFHIESVSLFESK